MDVVLAAILITTMPIHLACFYGIRRERLKMHSALKWTIAALSRR